MARVYPCEQCGKIIKADDDYVNVGIRIDPFPGPRRVHADCHEEYQKQKQAKKQTN
jgi:hypothetical protein